MKISIITREEVAVLLNTGSYNDVFWKTKRYLKKVSPNLNDGELEIASLNHIYEECLKAFRYNEYIDSAHKALIHISDKETFYMKHICEPFKSEDKRAAARAEALAEQEKERKKAEALKKKNNARMEKLKEKCEKEGLDFDTENRKYYRRMDILETTLNVLTVVFAVAMVIAVVLLFFSFSEGQYGTILTTIHTFAVNHRILTVGIGVASFFLSVIFYGIKDELF